MAKLKIIAPVVLLLIAGGAYKFVLAKPKAKAPEPKIAGQVYILPKEFLLNLEDGRYARLSVGLVLDPHQATTAESSGHGAAATPPEGFGTLAQEAFIRDIVTDGVTDDDARALVSRKGRKRLKKELLKSITEETDVKVEEILFTDIAVQ